MGILKDTKDYYIIKKSNLFDINWFKNNYNLSSEINPIKYYLKYGIKEGLNPSNDFDTLWYLNEYNDVKNSGMHPFVHYIRHGIGEHRLSKPLFVKNTDKFSLINQDYNPCFFNINHDNINENDVNVAIFIKNDLDNLLPTEYVRLIIPFYHLFLEKNFKPYIFSVNDLKEENFINVDVVIVQRDAIGVNAAKMLIEICKTNEIKLIYEIDDDLLGIDENHPDYNEFCDKKEVIQYLISNSDIVVVSTEYLKEKLISLNSNIEVIKNFSNDMLNLKNNSFNSDILKIGYMGTLTHKNDVKLIERAVDNVKDYFSKKGKKVIFETVGVSDEEIDCAEQIKIPFKYSKYPYFIRWLKRIVDWDIALAPLENIEFNKSKSEMKYLEYTSLGVPGIYSDFGTYGEVIENKNNGILIKNNSVEEWQSAIIDLIENTDLRESIVKNAHEYIENNYSIELIINSWFKIFEELLTKEKFHIFNKNSLKLLVNPSFNEDYYKIVESELFNKNEYPYVNQDPIYHFLSEGIFKGYNPSSEFNCQKYADMCDIDIYEINPFVYFIENYVLRFKKNIFTNENVEDIYQNLDRKRSIIIPIYNAYEDTKKCIESVLKYSTREYELILINDNSSDCRINILLKNYENNPNIKIINNQVNVGFVKSVNIGFKNSINDVILLNSDTIVTPNWIEKLTYAAYSDEKIATVTPFSNNAGVFSVPIMNENNIIPEKLGLNGVSNIIEKVSNHEYMRVPTGNGFCMYIKRRTIDTIGYFDDKTFKRGYCEENDFCMRAIYGGWENIIDDSTYIFHKGGVSFVEEKGELIHKNMQLLIRKHPDYRLQVRNFVNSKELYMMQENIHNALNKNSFNRKRSLHVSDYIGDLDCNGTDNYYLHVCDNLKLYYVGFDSLFKIKEWSSEYLDEICFNIIIKLGIDNLYIKNDQFNLEKSIKLIKRT